MWAAPDRPSPHQWYQRLLPPVPERKAKPASQKINATAAAIHSQCKVNPKPNSTIVINRNKRSAANSLSS